MSIYRIAGYMLLGFAAWSVLKAEKRRPRNGQASEAAPLPESRWEGEGGALPVSGAQLAPEPWHASDPAKGTKASSM